MIGRKIGITSIFEQDSGQQLSCSIVEVGPCTITQIKNKEKDGYQAIQLGFGDKKEKHTSKGLIHHYKKANTTPKRHLKEFRFLDISDKKLGDNILCSFFKEGDMVNVTGCTKGRGFQGVVKRHGFSGVGEASHGQHDRLRAPGSIGASSFPSRVFKGMKMAGQYGNSMVKIKNLKILKVILEKNYLLIRGAIPGYNQSIVYIQKNK